MSILSAFGAFAQGNGSAGINSYIFKALNE
jgi:hypothetical protein